MDCRTPGFPVLYYLLEFSQIHVHWVIPANHLLLRRPLILLPSVFPSIRVFSNESALCIRCPKYWSFSFSPSNEYSVLHEYSLEEKKKMVNEQKLGSNQRLGHRGTSSYWALSSGYLWSLTTKPRREAGHQKPSAPGVLFRCPARILDEFSFF